MEERVGVTENESTGIGNLGSIRIVPETHIDTVADTGRRNDQGSTKTDQVRSGVQRKDGAIGKGGPGQGRNGLDGGHDGLATGKGWRRLPGPIGPEILAGATAAGWHGAASASGEVADRQSAIGA